MDTDTTTPRRPRSSGPWRQRLVARVVHLLAAAALGTFVYAPAGLVEPARLALQLVVVPTATLTGLYLWKQAVVRRWLGRSHRP